MSATGYPKRSVCKHGDHPLSLDAPDAEWADAFGGRECADAPNPEDGPMPAHEPGIVLSPPTFPSDVTPSAAPLPFQAVYIPGGNG